LSKEACVLLDLDGTLIESEQIWHDVRLEYVVHHGGRWYDGAQQAMMGMRTQEWAAYIRTELGVDQTESAIARDVVNGVVDRLCRNLPILPGANDALERLASEFRLGLATSSALPVAQSVLRETGWDKRFAAVVSADQVAHGKPAPDVYLHAIELLGADTTRSAAVEDSTNGLRSAAAAGLVTIAIPNRGYPPEASALALAARVIPDLHELDVPLVRDALRRAAP
jgi:HAD superfamily hydrolase (TIGR01509 family)